MQYGIIHAVVMTLCYLGIIGGALLLAWPSVKRTLLIMKTRKRLYMGSRIEKKQSRLEEHIELLLTTTIKRNVSAKKFIYGNALLVMLIYYFGIQNLPAVSAVLIALMAGSMPYVFLRVRLESIRRKGSQEGERLVAALLNQYRIKNYNMYEAIERVVAQGGEYKVCRELLFRLLLEIRSTGSKEKIHAAADKFAKALHTNWGRMLAHNIRMSVEEGMNVSLGIEDILVQLREARAITEERKRLNGESVRIVAFLVPVLYVGSIVLSVRLLDIPAAQFMRNQFTTAEGFTLLMTAAFLFFVNIVAIELVMNQRLDY